MYSRYCDVILAIGISCLLYTSIFLTKFLKRVYFLPVARILEERRQQTEGVRELAQRAHAAADKRTSEFETAIQMVRTQLLQENEAQRRQWAEEQANLVAEARTAAEQQVAAAKLDIARELADAKSDLSLIHISRRRLA